MPRFPQPVSNSRFRFGDFELDPEHGVLLCRGTVAKLQPQPFHVLRHLLTRAPAVVSREELGDAVWGERGVHVDLDQSLSYCIRQIRQVLADSASVPMYIETLPRQGYRFIGALHGEAMSGAEAAATIPFDDTALKSSGSGAEAHIPAQAQALVELAPHQTKGRRLSVSLISLAVSLLIVLGSLWSLRWRRQPGTPTLISSIAVLPLENLSGDTGQDYFADGMTDELITELARIPNLRVVSRTSVMQDKGTHKPLHQIVNELGVDAVVEGSVMRVGDRMRITAQLIDARTDRNLWAESFEGQASDVLSLQHGVADGIASRARVALLPATEAGEAKERSVSPVAHDAYLRGLYFYNKRDVRRSATYFQKAIEADPKYASGYIGLANAFESEYTLDLADLNTTLPKGIELSKHAIWLSPSDGEAYTALGSQQTLAWDWAAAEANLKRGLQLSPSASLGEMKYAIYLDVTGHPEDAITHMRRALQLDPLSFLMNRHLGATLYFGRHYDEALEHLERAKEMEPNLSLVVDNWMSSIYEKKGMQGEAVNHDLVSLHGRYPLIDVSALLEVYRTKGWRAYWKARLDALSLSPKRCLAYERSLNAMRQGNRDTAFQELEKAVDQHCFWMMWSAVDPIFDDLRVMLASTC